MSLLLVLTLVKEMNRFRDLPFKVSVVEIPQSVSSFGIGFRGSRIISIVFLLVFVGVAGCESLDAERDGWDIAQGKVFDNRFQSRLEKLRLEAGFPGATAAYVLENGYHATFAVGYADLEKAIRMTPDARMLSGSTGKSFVAAVVLNLVQEGRIDLDAPISEWFGKEPWFHRLPNADEITLRMLLRHQSGLMDHVHSEKFIVMIREKMRRFGADACLSPLELVSIVFDTKPLFPAGQGYAYSDTNYILAGMIIERVTGNSYYEELTQRFIKPLDLNRTSPANSRYLAGLVPGYTQDDTFLMLSGKVMRDGKLIFNPQTEWTGGGLVTNSRDLARWAALLYTGRAMPGKYLHELLKTVPKDLSQQKQFGPDVSYGLGVTVRKTRFGFAYGHRGWAPGYLSLFEYYPAQGVAVALQINEQGHDVTAYLEALVAVIVSQQRTAGR